MSTFLRLELAGRTGDTILVNVDHIVRIHPSWPHGSSIVTSDVTSVNVRANLNELQTRLQSTGGRVNVFAIEAPVEVDEAYEAMRADLDDGREPIQPGDYRYYETPRGTAS